MSRVVAVAGGTGLVGGLVVDRLRRAGHEVHVLARATGVDVLTGRGLPAAVRGADAVVDGATAAVDTNVTAVSTLAATGAYLGPTPAQWSAATSPTRCSGRTCMGRRASCW